MHGLLLVMAIGLAQLRCAGDRWFNIVTAHCATVCRLAGAHCGNPAVDACASQRGTARSRSTQPVQATSNANGLRPRKA